MNWVDYLTGKSYNESNEEWNAVPPLTNDVFKLLLDVQHSEDDEVIAEARVFYQCQLRLRRYYSLVESGSTEEFDRTYSTLVINSPFWKFVDNSGLKTMRELALLEITCDCVMLRYLLPHLTKVRSMTNPLETEVDQGQFSQAFELIYYRLVRQLCALVELYGEPRLFRLFMCLGDARRAFLTTRQHIEPPQSYADLTEFILDEALIQGNPPHPMKQYGEIKRSLREILEKCHRGITHYRYFGIAVFRIDPLFPNSILDQFIYLLDPAAFPQTQVYPRVHKRAHLAIELTKTIIEKIFPGHFVQQFNTLLASNTFTYHHGM